jgi:hypothetical protein
MTDVGPVEVLAISLGPGAGAPSRVAIEAECLDGTGLVRVLDLQFVSVDETGDLVALDYHGDRVGGVVRALIGFGPNGERSGAARRASPGTPGLTREDLEGMVAQGPPGTVVGVLLLEHVWAQDFLRAVGEVGGAPLGEGFLSDTALTELAAELEMTARALDALERSAHPVLAAAPTR